MAASDAPGMNLCIRAVTRTALFNGCEVIGVREGYAQFNPLTVDRFAFYVFEIPRNL